MIKNKTNQSNKLYKKNLKKHGVGPKALLWKSKGAAHQRFREFWKEIDFTDKKVLDIGCGFGEMGKFLLKRYKGVDYSGIDIVPEFIKEAKIQVPGGKFEVIDFLNEKIDGSYDVVIASGVLNSNSEGNKINGDNMNYRKNAITKMFELTTKTLAFNMLGAHPQPKNDPTSNIWYADSLEIVKHCMSLTRRVVLRANYHPRDFTIIMQKIRS
ncbi:class I SAM-dependent methyltransferase [Candidatus Microgenomates bacterium]|nr:class I SAM-dependent methyltransferase [Candidatus Microgenomates bacterium]